MADEAPSRTSTDGDVLEKARQDIEEFHETHSQRRQQEGYDGPASMHACRVSLAQRNLYSLPGELIDVIKDHTAALALNQNHLSNLDNIGARLGECMHLHYLVLRENDFREFPREILSIGTLEILDIKGNKIRSLPEDLSKLQNLKNFTFQRNCVETIPSCVAHMKNLMSINTYKNPIKNPPRELWGVEDVQWSANDDEKGAREKERLQLETHNLKKLLSGLANQNKLRDFAESELSESNVETPRPTKRLASGRFPIKPSVDLSSIPMPASPALHKPPPIPSKSHARIPSQSTGSVPLRPGLETLVNGNNERNRSNSESVMTSVRSKRMGMITRKDSEQSRIYQKRLNRLSHNRGLSHGSALQHSVTALSTDSSSPTSPIDSEHRSIFVRRLSSLPEDSRKSRPSDPYVDLAQAVLYSLYQIHPPVKYIASLAREGVSKRSSLERAVGITFSFVEALSRHVESLEALSEETDEEDPATIRTSILNACDSSIKLFEQLASQLRSRMSLLVQHGSGPQLRTFMHLLYASLVEVNIAMEVFETRTASPKNPVQRDVSRGRSISPVEHRPVTSLRVSNSTPTTDGTRSSRSPRTKLYSAAPTRKPVTISKDFRRAHGTGHGSTYSRSGESSSPYTTPSTLTRSNTMTSIDELDEDRQFEKIFKSLHEACKKALGSLPRITEILLELKKIHNDRLGHEVDLLKYDALIESNKAALAAAEMLRARLSNTNIQDHRARNHVEFWQVCTTFTRAYTALASNTKEMSRSNFINEDIKNCLRPVQSAVKHASKLINDSHWQSYAVAPGQLPLNTAANHQHPALRLQTRGHPAPTSYPAEPSSAVSNHSVSSSGFATPGSYYGGTPLPATPMSAALGPAAVATLPASSSQAVSYFGNVSGSERSRSVSQRR